MNRNAIVLDSGRVINANRGVLGLSVLNDFDTLFTGYDQEAWAPGSIDPLSPPLTHEERAQIAEIMVASWLRWGNIPDAAGNRVCVPVLLGGSDNSEAWLKYAATVVVPKEKAP